MWKWNYLTSFIFGLLVSCVVALAGGGGETPQQTVAQKTQAVPAAASEGVEAIESFKAIASTLHMDVWWLTIVTFSFVWGLRGVLRFVKIDVKGTPHFFGVFQLEEGWWPSLRNWAWRMIAVVFASSTAAIAQHIAPETLPDVHWIVLGPTYGIGAVILYHIVDYIGLMKKLEGTDAG